MPNNSVKNSIGQHLTILPVVDSSNNYATSQINDGKAAHGSAYMALCQTAGKGQRQKHWHTGDGLNLALSIVVEPDFLPLHHQFMLHTYVCTSVLGYLQTLSAGFSIKWPNDIYYNDNKAAGILIENMIRGSQWRYAVIGIGLNVNETTIMDRQPNAIALANILGSTMDIAEIANGILQTLEKNWHFLTANPSYFFAPYCNYLYKKNNLITLKHQNKIFSTILKDVTTQGQLVCGENEELLFDFGAVAWVV